MPAQRIKRHQITPIYLLLILLAALHCPGSNAESYYRWQDEQGNAHFGDTHPVNAIKPLLIELPLQQPTYIVDKVIDGDTILVRHGGKVRLLGINTPEIAHRERAADPLGNKAHQRLKQLIEGKKVTLEFDQQRRDRFKRLLAHVTMEDGTNLNELLLREGLARALFLQPNMNHLQDYFRIEAEAQKEKRGLWALPEYQIRPAHNAQQCIKHFCRLRGTVRHVEKKKQYTYLQLAGELQVAIHNHQLPQLRHAGMDPAEMRGKTIIVRGWIGQRKGKPYIKLQHTLQMQSLIP